MTKYGVLLAGGTGSRLAPLTQVVNKHLLGLNGKFIIDYPIQTLKNMGVENVTVVLGGAHFSQVAGYLQDGARYGMNFNYVFQGEAKGISQGVNICKSLLTNTNQFAVVLGDNIFEDKIDWKDSDHAQIVLSEHQELNRFGIATVYDGKIIKIEEKPKVIDYSYDNYAITGAYLFDQEYFDFFAQSKLSARGEYEIADIINSYHKSGKLDWTIAKNLWSDAGTHESIKFLNNYFYNK